MAAPAPAAMVTAPTTVSNGFFSASTVTMEMAPGPAMSGIAIGTTSGSSSPSLSITRRAGNTIPSAIMKSTMPPEMPSV